jgi:myo-inositol catabolism protein IolS
MLKNIAFGGASLSGDGAGYGFGELIGTSAHDLINHAIELGIEYYDFAPIYGFHQAEQTMGKALGANREKVKLISKAGVTWHDNKRVDMNNSPKNIQKMFEQSLKNFNSDYIDIYFIHWPDKNTDIRFSVDVLQTLKAQGKIKKIGLSNTHQTDFELAQEVAQIDYLQGECNLFNQLPFKSDACKSMGWGTLDKGILSSSVKLDRKFTSHDARSHAFWWKKSNWREKVEFVNKIRKKYELSESELKSIAIKFSLKTVDLPIIGVKSIEQLNEVRNLITEEVPKHYDEVVNEFTLF